MGRQKGKKNWSANGFRGKKSERKNDVNWASRVSNIMNIWDGEDITSSLSWYTFGIKICNVKVTENGMSQLCHQGPLCSDLCLRHITIKFLFSSRNCKFLVKTWLGSREIHSALSCKWVTYIIFQVFPFEGKNHCYIIYKSIKSIYNTFLNHRSVGVYLIQTLLAKTWMGFCKTICKFSRYTYAFWGEDL